MERDRDDLREIGRGRRAALPERVGPGDGRKAAGSGREVMRVSVLSSHGETPRSRSPWEKDPRDSWV